jgi:hypothetical protein
MAPNSNKKFFAARQRSSGRGPLERAIGMLEEALYSASTPHSIIRTSSHVDNAEPAGDDVSRRLQLDGADDFSTGETEKPAALEPCKNANLSRQNKNFNQSWSKLEVCSLSRRNSRESPHHSPRLDSPRNRIRKPPLLARSITAAREERCSDGVVRSTPR